MEPSGETILVADDDPYIGKVLTDRLQSLGYRVLLTASGKGVLEILDRHDPQLALLDIAMPDLGGMEVLKEIRQRGWDFPVVMITAYGSIDLAVEAMRAGAYDFIAKPFKPDHVALVVQKTIEQQKLRRKVDILAEESDKRHQLLIGKSAQLNQALEAARKAASAKATVLLLGESGTGKELFARAIHNWSERKDGPFVAINCVGLSRELLESELFGHEKGAFTGAHQLKKGKMELAHGGTVFLDELGDISPDVQAKLLRFLQEREFERVGGTKLIRVDVRFVAATNRDIAAYVRDGRFREDLYHRLNVIPITLPPLRERSEDITELCHFYLRRFSLDAKKNFTGITDEALEKLTRYHWPGNVRELANVMEHAVVLGQSAVITSADLPPTTRSYEPGATLDSFSYRDSVDNYRRALVLKVLAQTGSNRVAAAKTLGLHEKSLIRLIRALQIH
ncbi:MAG: sigma-54-dependent transcriptional regulator [Candidatus Binatia bacterium]